MAGGLLAGIAGAPLFGLLMTTAGFAATAIFAPETFGRQLGGYLTEFFSPVTGQKSPREKEVEQQKLIAEKQAREEQQAREAASVGAGKSQGAAPTEPTPEPGLAYTVAGAALNNPVTATGAAVAVGGAAGVAKGLADAARRMPGGERGGFDSRAIWKGISARVQNWTFARPTVAFARNWTVGWLGSEWRMDYFASKNFTPQEAASYALEYALDPKKLSLNSDQRGAYRTKLAPLLENLFTGEPGKPPAHEGIQKQVAKLAAHALAHDPALLSDPKFGETLRAFQNMELAVDKAVRGFGLWESPETSEFREAMRQRALAHLAAGQAVPEYTAEGIKKTELKLFRDMQKEGYEKAHGSSATERFVQKPVVEALLGQYESALKPTYDGLSGEMRAEVKNMLHLELASNSELIVKLKGLGDEKASKVLQRTIEGWKKTAAEPPPLPGKESSRTTFGEQLAAQTELATLEQRRLITKDMRTVVAEAARRAPSIAMDLKDGKGVETLRALEALKTRAFPGMPPATPEMFANEFAAQERVERALKNHESSAHHAEMREALLERMRVPENRVPLTPEQQTQLGEPLAPSETAQARVNKVLPPKPVPTPPSPPLPPAFRPEPGDPLRPGGGYDGEKRLPNRQNAAQQRGEMPGGGAIDREQPVPRDEPLKLGRKPTAQTPEERGRRLSRPLSPAPQTPAPQIPAPTPLSPDAADLLENLGQNPRNSEFIGGIRERLCAHEGRYGPLTTQQALDVLARIQHITNGQGVSGDVVKGNILLHLGEALQDTRISSPAVDLVRTRLFNNVNELTPRHESFRQAVIERLVVLEAQGHQVVPDTRQGVTGPEATRLTAQENEILRRLHGEFNNLQRTGHLLDVQQVANAVERALPTPAPTPAPSAPTPKMNALKLEVENALRGVTLTDASGKPHEMARVQNLVIEELIKLNAAADKPLTPEQAAKLAEVLPKKLASPAGSRPLLDLVREAVHEARTSAAPVEPPAQKTPAQTPALDLDIVPREIPKRPARFGFLDLASPGTLWGALMVFNPQTLGLSREKGFDPNDVQGGALATGGALLGGGVAGAFYDKAAAQLKWAADFATGGKYANELKWLAPAEAAAAATLTAGKNSAALEAQALKHSTRAAFAHLLTSGGGAAFGTLRLSHDGHAGEKIGGAVMVADGAVRGTGALARLLGREALEKGAEKLLARSGLGPLLIADLVVNGGYHIGEAFGLVPEHWSMHKQGEIEAKAANELVRAGFAGGKSYYSALSAVEQWKQSAEMEKDSPELQRMLRRAVLTQAPAGGLLSGYATLRGVMSDVTLPSAISDVPLYEDVCDGLILKLGNIAPSLPRFKQLREKLIESLRQENPEPLNNYLSLHPDLKGAFGSLYDDARREHRERTQNPAEMEVMLKKLHERKMAALARLMNDPNMPAAEFIDPQKHLNVRDRSAVQAMLLGLRNEPEKYLGLESSDPHKRAEAVRLLSSFHADMVGWAGSSLSTGKSWGGVALQKQADMVNHAATLAADLARINAAYAELNGSREFTDLYKGKVQGYRQIYEENGEALREIQKAKAEAAVESRRNMPQLQEDMKPYDEKYKNEIAYLERHHAQLGAAGKAFARTEQMWKDAADQDTRALTEENRAKHRLSVYALLEEYGVFAKNHPDMQKVARERETMLQRYEAVFNSDAWSGSDEGREFRRAFQAAAREYKALAAQNAAGSEKALVGALQMQAYGEVEKMALVGMMSLPGHAEAMGAGFAANEGIKATQAKLDGLQKAAAPGYDKAFTEAAAARHEVLSRMAKEAVIHMESVDVSAIAFSVLVAPSAGAREYQVFNPKGSGISGPVRNFAYRVVESKTEGNRTVVSVEYDAVECKSTAGGKHASLRAGKEKQTARLVFEHEGGVARLAAFHRPGEAETLPDWLTKAPEVPQGFERFTQTELVAPSTLSFHQYRQSETHNCQAVQARDKDGNPLGGTVSNLAQVSNDWIGAILSRQADQAISQGISQGPPAEKPLSPAPEKPKPLTSNTERADPMMEATARVLSEGALSALASREAEGKGHQEIGNGQLGDMRAPAGLPHGATAKGIDPRDKPGATV